VAAGQLNQPVKLYRRDVAIASGTGTVLEQFSPAISAWARVDPAGGAEARGGELPRDESSVRFRIRYRADLDTTWQIEWRGRRFGIDEVIPAGHQLREWLDVRASDSIAENPSS
jgi:SPP1 family predicted phage head-tail adaptor